MEGIEKLDLLEFYRKDNKEDKKIRMYIPEFWDILTSALKENIESFIQQRRDARKAKNYVEGDRIRNELKNRGIVLTDHKDGTTTWWNEENDILLEVGFQLPKKDSIKINYTLTVYSNFPSRLWMNGISNSEYDNMFDNFHLATDFTLHIRDEKQYLVNSWNDEIKTMIVHKNHE